MRTQNKTRQERCFDENVQVRLAISLALSVGIPAARAQEKHERDGVPKLDHVFVIVLENHNSFASFGSNGILDNPQAPQIQALAKKYNVAPNYHGVCIRACRIISR